MKLTEDEYSKLLSNLGQVELDWCIQYVDESAQTSGNKNRWKDWNLVLRCCAREGWGQRPAPTGSKTPDDYWLFDEDPQKTKKLPGVTYL